MPYIAQDERTAVDSALQQLPPLISAGMLNYAVTQLLLKFFTNSAKNYSAINAVMGVLSCAGQEFYRRVAAPYENKKCAEAGEVYHV